jgi:hypothetical protein
MSSSNKSKSRSTGNKPLHMKDILTPSASSVHPLTLKAKAANKQFQSRQTTTLSKNQPVNKKTPLTTTRNTGTKIKFSGDGSKTVNIDRTAIFDEGNPHLHGLHKKKGIKTAEENEPGNVNKLVKMYEQRIANQKGGKKTRKNKKSKKSKTRSKRCCC